VQLKRTTEGGLQTGYVLVVDGKIEKMPENELAMDCMLPEVLTISYYERGAKTAALTFSYTRAPPTALPPSTSS